ncbi:hypothetical protein L1987_85056 [Smallanthus sonchifolius]|uniref:Uncharacterized protein n=1 Tax=Smallanthus sonchifolius TaxID=185202 RepID=A0ACB8XVP1_9ASTR|nr:hypothetical protein L1987_85056 [Smallanthus sonchifolius]
MGSQPEHTALRYHLRANSHPSGSFNSPECHQGQCIMVISELNNVAKDPIWQSFDSLQHTLLPGEKLGWNLDTGKERHLTAWKSEEDPAFSEFSYLIDARGYPHPMITKGQEIQYRAGPWNGLSACYGLTTKKNGTFICPDQSISVINTRCVGHFGICNIEKSPICDCLKGFEPTSPDHWRITDWSQGCRHTITLDCKPGEGFSEYSNLKLPDTRESWFNQTMTLAECEEMCRSNCSCTAYANSNIIGSGSGCMLWFGIPGNEPGRDHENRSDDENLEIPLLGLSAILKATNNFSINNKLGEGGFGPVYKGVLEDGQEIAVKRIKLKANGYMAPEYAGDGIFSIKSDVYSFGVLVLEIVSGDKNTGFVHKEHCNNLIGHLTFKD